MLFSIVCFDKKDHGHVRAENRPAHLEHLNAHADHVFAAGPMVGDDGESMIGSLLLMNFDNKPAAEAFATNDPYNKAGLFESVTVAPWKKVLPAD